MQITSDSELQNIINSANQAQFRHKVKRQMVKEYEVVDGFPVLDEYEHLDMERGGEHNVPRRTQPYSVDFRLPLKGLSRQLISPTQINVCNMFSTFYFLQLVVVLRSKSIKIPGQR
mmetsp:Transcript_8554/g.14430  ORF Transcript_8554/g.14430 Transcript_8554/m.14430 type:complete len:116 (+) Transcript_8554:679-1026(+)